MKFSEGVKQHDQIMSEIYPLIHEIAQRYVNEMVESLKAEMPPPEAIADEVEALKGEYTEEMILGLKLDILDRWDAVVLHKDLPPRCKAAMDYEKYISSGGWLNDDE